MPKIMAGLACPLCDQSGITSELYQSTPSLAVLCESGKPDHSWLDTSQLQASNPRRLDVAKKTDIPQTGHVPFQVLIPQSVLTTLKAKFGDHLQVNLASVLQACSEPEIVILNASDLARLEERTGMKPKGASELFGLIFQLGEEIKSLTADKERLTQNLLKTRGGKLDGPVVDLGPFHQKAVAKSADSGYELDDFLSKYLQVSLENDWISL